MKIALQNLVTFVFLYIVMVVASPVLAVAYAYYLVYLDKGEGGDDCKSGDLKEDVG